MFSKLFSRRKTEPVPEPVVPVTALLIAQSMMASSQLQTQKLSFGDDLMNAFDSYQDTLDASSLASLLTDTLSLASPRIPSRTFISEPLTQHQQPATPPQRIERTSGDKFSRQEVSNTFKQPLDRPLPDLRIYKSMQEFDASSERLNQHATKAGPALTREPSSDSSSSQKRVASSTKSASAVVQSPKQTTRVLSQNLAAPISQRTKSQTTVLSATKSLPVEGVKREKPSRALNAVSRKPGKSAESPSTSTLANPDSDDEPLVKYKPQSQSTVDLRTSQVARQSPKQLAVDLRTTHLLATSDQSIQKLANNPLAAIQDKPMIAPLVPLDQQMHLTPEQQQQMLMMYYTQMALMQQTTQMQSSLGKSDRKKRDRGVVVTELVISEHVEKNSVVDESVKSAHVEGLDSEVTFVDADSVEA